MARAWNILEKVVVRIIFIAISIAISIYSARVAYLLLADTDRKHEVCIVKTFDGIDYMHYTKGRRSVPDGIGYFCFGLDKDSGEVYVMRAKKHWFDENFPNGVAKDPDGVHITAVEFSGDKNLKNTLIEKWAESPVVGADGTVLSLALEEGSYLLLDSKPAIIFSLALGILSLCMLALEIKMTISDLKGTGEEEVPDDGTKKKPGIRFYIDLFVILGFGLALLYFHGRYGILW